MERRQLPLRTLVREVLMRSAWLVVPFALLATAGLTGLGQRGTPPAAQPVRSARAPTATIVSEPPPTRPAAGASSASVPLPRTDLLERLARFDRQDLAQLE